MGKLSIAAEKVYARLVGFSLLVILILSALVPSTATSVEPTATVGIYAGPGTWDEGRAALKNFLTLLNISWQEFSLQEINERDLHARFRALWFPGGWAGEYQAQITHQGKEQIREFVVSGGVYLGSSAGAYFACDEVIWQGTRYDYDLDLFKGSAVGPIEEIAPWPKFTFTPVLLDATHPANPGAPASLEMLFLGEPDFHPQPVQAMQILGRWAVTQTPGIISFQYGKGKAVLFGPHPEIGYDDDAQSWDLWGGHGAQWHWLTHVIQWALSL